jgi:hypothetical protein
MFFIVIVCVFLSFFCRSCRGNVAGIAFDSFLFAVSKNPKFSRRFYLNIAHFSIQINKSKKALLRIPFLMFFILTSISNYFVFFNVCFKLNFFIKKNLF